MLVNSNKAILGLALVFTIPQQTQVIALRNSLIICNRWNCCCPHEPRELSTVTSQENGSKSLLAHIKAQPHAHVQLPALSSLRLLGLGGRSPRALWCTRLESVLEQSGDGLQVTHAAGSGGLSSLGLLAPVVCWSCVSLLSPCHQCFLLEAENNP
jgi:hypothetical protein